MRTIKRYSNRKLYDTTQRHHVTLAQVAELVRGGYDLQVVDHVTGADLTSSTLAQVIFDEARRGPGVPVEVLRKIIVEGIPDQSSKN